MNFTDSGYLYYKFIKKLKKEKSVINHSVTIKNYQGNFFYKLLWLLPKRIILNYFNKKDQLEEYSIWCVAGEQGSGKNLTASALCQWLRKKYGDNIEIGTNIDLTYKDYSINTFEDFTERKNVDSLGNVGILDEAHLMFNNLGTNAKNFNPDYLQAVTQNRKHKRLCIMLTQTFNRLNICIRQNTYRLIEPKTFLGCFTICPIYKLETAADGQTVEKKHISTFWFVHTDELYNSYDTWEFVEKLGKHGFKENTDTENFITINTLEEKIKKGAKNNVYISSIFYNVCFLFTL